MPTTAKQTTTPTEAPPALLRVRQVAEELGVSVCTVRRRIADGTLAMVKFGGLVLIPRTELTALTRSAL
jgi:excisionase family DNA binding protein